MNDSVTRQTRHPILALTKARLIEFTRRPEAMFWVYFFPVLMVVVLGVAFRNKPVDIIDIDLVDSDAALWVSVAVRGERISLHRHPLEECRERLRTGKTTLIINAEGDNLDNVSYLFDPSRPGSLEARNEIENRLQIAAGRKDVIKTTDIEYKEPGGRYVDFLVPGLLGMGLMGGGLWGVGFAIVDLRIRKLLKRFMATPMKRSHFLLAMMLSRLVFMIPQIVILLVFSYFVFGVTIQGNWAAVLFIIVLGAFEFAGVGLLVAARAQTLETVSGLMNLIMLPMWTLSGIFFSYERFPEIAQPIIRWLPLTPVIDSLRGIMMDGKSLTEMGFEIMVMTVWCVSTFVIAMAIFRWND